MAGTLSTQRRGASTPRMGVSEAEGRLMSLVTSQRAEYHPRSSTNAHADNDGGPLYTRGEIEAAICEFITRFEQDFMGRGPKSIRAHLIGELLVVRLQGVLTAAEQQLVKSHQAAKGRDPVQVRHNPRSPLWQRHVGRKPRARGTPSRRPPRQQA